MNSSGFTRAVGRIIGVVAIAASMSVAGGGLALAGGGGGGGGGDGGGGMFDRSFQSKRGAEPKSASAVMALMGDGVERVIIVDVRPKADFARAHLRGAINMPMGQLDKAALGGDKSARIVVYGASERDEAATKLARTIVGEGFTNVIWMRGGLAEWVAARLPLDAATTQTATN